MTIKDIAKESGYAVGTVSRVLNNQANVSEEARRIIIEIVEKHNFSLNNVAKNLKQQVNKSIAILVKGNDNQLFAAMVENLQEYITKRGYFVVVTYFDEDENEVEKAISTIMEQKPMGIIFLGGIKSNFQKSFSKIKVPCVLATNAFIDLDFENLASVTVDDKKAAFDAIMHLIDNGHRNIGVVGGDLKLSDISSKRYEGVKLAHKERNLNFDINSQYVVCRYSLESGYEGCKKLIANNKNITAVFAMSDVMGIGAMRAIHDMGLKVPEDISVIAFDGLDIGKYTFPRLTSIKQHKKDMAKKCVELLVAKIEGLNSPTMAISTHAIREGESVKNLKIGQ